MEKRLSSNISPYGKRHWVEFQWEGEDIISFPGY